MSEEENPSLQKLFDQLSSPWDWIAAGGGAAAGAGVTLLSAGLDLGTATATGAMAGLTARRAVVAVAARPGLRKRARNLHLQLERAAKQNQAYHPLLDRLIKAEELWSTKIITNEQFSALLDDLVQEYLNPPPP